MYDLAVIGGGPAGYSAALEAASRGLSVILFEKDQLGGTCLNRGCVPTKYFSHVARQYRDLLLARDHGMVFSGSSINPKRMQERKKEIVTSLKDGLRQQLLHGNVRTAEGTARIMDPSHVICGNCIHETKNILIAAGSVDARPFPDGAVSASELLEFQEIPGSLQIVGGGTVAVEFAYIFQMLGSRVSLSVRGDRILRNWDREIALGITHSMKQRGIQIQTKYDFSDFKPGNGEVVLSATGRIPDTEGLDSTWFDFGEDGGIVADDAGRTRTPGIFAAGDVTEGSSRLAHTAMEQGRRVAQFLSGVPMARQAARVRCIYMNQEAAMAGVTAEEAEAAGKETVTAKQTMYSNARTRISTEERGFVKLVAEKKTGAILGAQLLCQRAGDLVAELALAINQGLTAEDLLCSTRPHPSYCEAVTEAARLLEEKRREV